MPHSLSGPLFHASQEDVEREWKVHVESSMGTHRGASVGMQRVLLAKGKSSNRSSAASAPSLAPLPPGWQK